MSLDNVLAVAGAAREHPGVLIFGLSLSILLMGVAARFIAGLLHRYRWIGYIGLAVILYVALGMVFRGARGIDAGRQRSRGLSARVSIRLLAWILVGSRPDRLFDEIVGIGEQRSRHCKADGLRGPQIDDELKSGGKLDRQICRLRALENCLGQRGRAFVHVDGVRLVPMSPPASTPRLCPNMVGRR